VLVEVDLAGARAIKEAMPEGVSVFLAPPSMEELERRLLGRNTETAATFARRLETAREEMAARHEFDVTVISDEPRAVAGRLVELLVATPLRTQESSS
jgi:guanylate kinase